MSKEEELIEVDERINSKKMLLNEKPDDVGLKLGLMAFEGLKEDLIRESEFKKYNLTRMIIFENWKNNEEKLDKILLNLSKEELIELAKFTIMSRQDILEELMDRYRNKHIESVMKC